MCGIAGILYASPIDASHGATLTRRMAETLRHRGPAGEGFWNNDDHTLFFGHRRLAILDLSDASAQPLHYLHYTIVYNGEIYNYKELKATLKASGYRFTSTGDTEIIPAAYDKWGLDCLHQLDGMFAFALYDSRSCELLLARDRFGEKPLYYAKPAVGGNKKNKANDTSLAFASEMKALWAVGADQTPDDTMLLNYLTLGYVQYPRDKSRTFFKAVRSLPPGHFIKLPKGQLQAVAERWYFPSQSIARLDNAFITEATALENFAGLLETSVARRLRSDVAVGTSLSGGLDSSAILATVRKIAASAMGANAKAFTAIFPGFKKDEFAWSKKVADACRVQQYIVSPSGSDLATNWPQLMHYQEEPVQSSSALVQYMVYGLAKQQEVTVLLDGQGADETLGGYRRYTHWYLQQLVRTNMPAFRHEKKMLMKHQLLEEWSYKNLAAAFMPRLAANQLSFKARQSMPGFSFLKPDFLASNLEKESFYKPPVQTLEDILYYNSFEFGLEELLRYADRNSMAHSREVRLPFLFHELVEFVFSLPSHFKIKDGLTKWILRQTIKESLPPQVVWRTDKIGYEPPQEMWMKQPAMQELILHSRQQLVDSRILQDNVMQAPVNAAEAHSAANQDWRILNAAAML